MIEIGDSVYRLLARFISTDENGYGKSLKIWEIVMKRWNQLHENIASEKRRIKEDQIIRKTEKKARYQKSVNRCVSLEQPFNNAPASCSKMKLISDDDLSHTGNWQHTVCSSTAVHYLRLHLLVFSYFQTSMNQDFYNHSLDPSHWAWAVAGGGPSAAPAPQAPNFSTFSAPSDKPFLPQFGPEAGLPLEPIPPPAGPSAAGARKRRNEPMSRWAFRFLLPNFWQINLIKNFPSKKNVFFLNA